MPDFDKISINGTYYNVKDTAAQQQIAEETEARESADTSIKQQITEETKAREAADTALGQQIAAASKYKTIVDYGAVEGGTQDCSAAIMAQIAAEGVARVPVGFFLVSKDMNLKECTIIGDYTDLSYAYSVTDNNSSTLVCTVTQTIDKLTAYNVLFIPSTSGSIKSGSKAFAAPSGQRSFSSLFVGCAFRYWDNVAAFVGSFNAQQCTFYGNNYAIHSIEDSRITQCLFASNIWAIYIGDGWGADIIEGNKVEWNGNESSGGGIACSQTQQVTITGNIIDRCGPTGLSVWSSRRITAVGNIIHRSYVQNELWSNMNYCTAMNTNYKNYWDSDTEQGVQVPTIGLKTAGGSNSYIVSVSDCPTPYSEDNKGTNVAIFMNGKQVQTP